jgi:ketosteroid isomerase-like protein
MNKQCRMQISLALIAIAGASPTTGWGDSDTSIGAIHDTYVEWVASTNAKDIDKWSTFVAPGAVFLPPDSPPLESHETIVAYYTELFRDPNFSLSCSQSHVEVANSGDMAWSRGKCKATFSLPDGTVGHGSSKWAKVWVRLENQKWKCRLNTWNSD